MKILVDTLVGIMEDEMSAEKDILDSAATLLEMPYEIRVENSDSFTRMENVLERFVAEPMNTNRGRIRATRLLMKSKTQHI